ncbi:MAG: hypothetical protein IRY85_15450 [Micromonosporaceae bacterium]|nr:hypothetical protein [Micromonosporaceae bacterium]
MDLARPLRNVFADLAGGRDFGASSGMAPEEVLAAHGHPDLPEGLVAEAVVSYADTAPVEVAEHLAPYVRAHTAVPQPGGGTGEPEPHWYDLLTTAPAPELGGPDVIDAEASGLAATDAPSVDAGPGASAETDIDGDFAAGDFGAGDLEYGYPGPVEDPAGLEPAEDATLGWPATTDATTDPTIDPDAFDAGADLDLGPTDEGSVSADEAGPGEEPDAMDGA